MEVIQLVENFKPGDGVGNTVLAFDGLLKKLGCETRILDGHITTTMLDSGTFSEGVTLFYHLAVSLDPLIKHVKCKKVLVFHNITYPELIDEFDPYQAMLCARGLYDVKKSKDFFDYAIVFSSFSKKCLLKEGWDAEKIYEVPLLVRLDKFKIEPSETLLNKYNDDYTNVVFMGRVYPNKKHEDIIACFNEYYEKYNKKSRLFLVGSLQSPDYARVLKDYADTLPSGGNIFFSGFTDFSEYLAYYSLANVFLCMSEHEGFCIPLVEAMYFDVPIVAYNCTAIPDTLDGTGVLLSSKNPKYVAELINRIVSDEQYRGDIVQRQRIRLEELRPETIQSRYENILIDVISHKDASVKNDDKSVLIHFDNSLPKQLEKFSLIISKDNPLIIYGAGVGGAQLYEALVGSIGRDRMVICDKNKAGTEDLRLKTVVQNPEEVLEMYSNSLVIISLMNKKMIVNITEYLVQHGITSDRIAVFDKDLYCIY